MAPTYPADVYRSNVVGTLAAPQESIVHTMWHHVTWNADVHDTTIACNQIALKVQAAWLAFLGVIGPRLVQQLVYTRVDTYAINAVGGSTNKGTVGMTTGNAGTGTVSDLPYEVAMAVTLRTSSTTYFDQHPRSAHGRFYLGGLTSNAMKAQGGGRFDSAVLPAWGTPVGVLLNAVTNIGFGGGSTAKADLVVVDRVRGKYRVVTRWDIGDVPDSQRRRRKGLVESRTTKGTVSPSASPDGPQP